MISAATSTHFWIKSIAELAQDGKIISVRLALFAEMVKGKPWTPATLQGSRRHRGRGCDLPGRNLQCLDRPSEHRLHQKAAQAVLKALLPETGTDIKGQMRSARNCWKHRVMRTAPGTSLT